MTGGQPSAGHPGQLLRGHVRNCADHHTFTGQAGAVQGDRQSEVTYLGRTVLGKPHVSRFKPESTDRGRVATGRIGKEVLL